MITVPARMWKSNQQFHYLDFDYTTEGLGIFFVVVVVILNNWMLLSWSLKKRRKKDNVSIKNQ